MLLRPGALPNSDQWAFELKWNGFRAIVSTENGLRVRSRRGWNMTNRVPELAVLPRGLVLDGELVAFNDKGAPHRPLLCERVLHGNRSIQVTFVAFDVLRVDGNDLMGNTWAARRALLEELGVERRCVRLSDVFETERRWVDHGLEGVVAKRRNGVYRPGYRGWTKIKNPVLATRVRARGDAKACRLNDPLDGPGNQHPPGEAGGNAPQPRGTNGHLVAVHFVSHVGTPFSNIETPLLRPNRVSPSLVSGYPRDAPAKPLGRETVRAAVTSAERAKKSFA